MINVAEASSENRCDRPNAGSDAARLPHAPASTGPRRLGRPNARPCAGNRRGLPCAHPRPLAPDRLPSPRRAPPGCPAERAGVKAGDLVLGVAGERTVSLADFLRKVWRLGGPGVEVPLMLAREGDVLRLNLRSADRNDFLKKPRLH